MPPHLPEDNQVTFKSTFAQTYLNCEISHGKIVIKSNNISALTIIKDTITQEATQRKMHLDLSSDIKDQSYITNLELLHPILDEQYSLAKKVQMIEGLKELSIENNEEDFLSEEYKSLLKEADQVQAAFKSQPRKLSYIWAIIADLYNDVAKVKGIHNVSNQMPKLRQILNNYSLESLIGFFKQSLN